MPALALPEIARDLTEWWPEQWLPKRPYATDRLSDGIWREPRRQAMGRRYIEVNPPAFVNVLPLDLDHSDAALRVLSSNRNHPIPNLIAESPSNGHAHALWVLKTPVVRTEYGRRKPLAYAAAVGEGLRRAVSGDRGYSGLMTKNPLHSDWGVTWIRAEPWTLDEMAKRLGNHMPERGWHRTARPADIAGLGRNCSLFDSTRLWSYQQFHHFHDDWFGFQAAVHQHIEELNGEFPCPLPIRETRSIAKSISQWTFRHFDPDASRERFIAIQAARGRRSGTVRHEKAVNRWAEVKGMRDTGLTYQEIGDRLGISKRAVEGLIRRGQG